MIKLNLSRREQITVDHRQDLYRENRIQRDLEGRGANLKHSNNLRRKIVKWLSVADHKTLRDLLMILIQ
jgi:hypothetical protein